MTVKHVSLRVRVAAVVALVAAVAALIMGILGMRIIRGQMLEATECAASDMVSMLAVQLDDKGLTPARIKADPAIREQARQVLSDTLERLAVVNSNWKSASILSPDGKEWRLVVAASHGPAGEVLHREGDVFPIEAEEPEETLEIGHSTVGWYHTDVEDWFGSATTLRDRSGLVAMGMRMSELREFFLQVLELALASLALAIVVGVALGWWGSRRSVQPIEQVRAFAASVDAGNFKARLAEHGPPEILALMQDMNRMATSLGERDALLRRNKALTGEVRSHESRMAAFEAIEVDFAELGDLDQLMRRMLEGVVQVLPCELAAVLLGDGNHMGVSHARCGGDSKLARVLLGQFCVLPDTTLSNLRAGKDHAEPRLANTGIAALSASSYADRPALLVPLRSGGGDLLGVLLTADPRTRDRSFREAFTEQDAANLRHFSTLMAMSLERQRFTDRLIARMIRMTEIRDPRETGAHVKRVSGVSMELFDAWAQRHNLRDEDAQVVRTTLRTASMLHDVGKVGISDSILQKPGKLTDEEYAAMKRHTILGAALLPGDGAQDEAAREVALHHHERWDGKGYPGQVDIKSAHGDIEKLLALPLPTTGLKEYDIPLFARIVAIADVYDALSSPRAYKEAWPEAKVIETIKADAGTAFDPELVQIFVERYDRIRAAWSMHPDSANEDA